jgi:hypothetical protein
MTATLLALLLLAQHGAWQDRYVSASGTACCGRHDCQVARVYVREREATTVTVDVNGVAMTLPAGSVHLSEDTQGWWCAKDREEPVSTENTRCAFVAVGG